MKKQILKNATALMLTLVMLLTIFPMTALTYEYEAMTDPLLAEGELLTLEPFEALPVATSDLSIDAFTVDKNDLVATDMSFDDGVTNFVPISIEADETYGERASGHAVADITNIRIGNLTHELTASNTHDILYFSMPVARQMFLSFSSPNPNFVVTLGAVDTAGNVFFFGGANLFPGGAASWNAGTTNAQFPYFAFVIHSIGSLGSSYTLNWNKSVPVASVSQFLFVSPDVADVVYLVTGNNHIGLNGITTIHLGYRAGWGSGSDHLDWYGAWRINTGTGHSRRSITVADVQIERVSATNLRPSSMGFLDYVGRAPGSGSSTLAIALPLGPNTLYHNFRSIFNSNANPPSTIIQTCYLGLQTPRRLFTDPFEIMFGDRHYIIIDISTGTSIDLVGNLNKIVSIDGHPPPIMTPLPNLW